MSIPLAATSVQIKSLTSFLWGHKKIFTTLTEWLFSRKACDVCCPFLPWSDPSYFSSRWACGHRGDKHRKTGGLYCLDLKKRHQEWADWSCYPADDIVLPLCVCVVSSVMPGGLELSADSAYLLPAAWNTAPCCHSRSWCDRRLWPGPSCALWWPALRTRPLAPWWLRTTFLRRRHAVLFQITHYATSVLFSVMFSNRGLVKGGFSHIRGMKSSLILSYLQNWLLAWCYLWRGLHPSVDNETDQRRETLSMCHFKAVIVNLTSATIRPVIDWSYTWCIPTSRMCWILVFDSNIFATMNWVLSPTWGTHPDVILAQTLPEAIALRIDGHDHMVDGLRDRVLPLQVYPSGEVHDALGQLLHIERMQSGRANNHLEERKSTSSLQLTPPNHRQRCDWRAVTERDGCWRHVAQRKNIRWHMHNSSQCYLQSLSIRRDLRDLIVDPVDKVCVACGQEAVLRGKWVSDFRGNIILYLQAVTNQCH